MASFFLEMLLLSHTSHTSSTCYTPCSEESLPTNAPLWRAQHMHPFFLISGSFCAPHKQIYRIDHYKVQGST